MKYTQSVPQTWVEARERQLLGKVLALLLKYANGFDSTHKRNIDKHGKSGEISSI